jgi:predicted GNAT family N-acyltransferase
LYNEFNIPPLTQTLDSIMEEFYLATYFLKGVIDGNLIASVRGYIKDNTTYIGRLIVKKEVQNNKFGQTLMKKNEIQLDNCTRYELFTGFKSEKNLKLYQKQFINANLTLVYLEKVRQK